MDYITIYMLQELKAAGFSFPEYENDLNNGMIFYYQDDEHWIGGSSKKPFTEHDRIVAERGDWLPDATQLLEWLKNTNFQVAISLGADRNYSVQATDLQNGKLYCGKSQTLAYSLANVILKICKSKQREYIPAPMLRLQILDE